MIHGLTYSSHEFDVDYKDYSLSRFLARNGYNVWLLDITGYGQSDPIENGFIADSNYAAEDIHAAVKFISEQNGQRKIDILGWSWGTVTTNDLIVNVDYDSFEEIGGNTIFHIGKNTLTLVNQSAD